MNQQKLNKRIKELDQQLVDLNEYTLLLEHNVKPLRQSLKYWDKFNSELYKRILLIRNSQ